MIERMSQTTGQLEKPPVERERSGEKNHHEDKGDKDNNGRFKRLTEIFRKAKDDAEVSFVVKFGAASAVFVETYSRLMVAGSSMRSQGVTQAVNYVTGNPNLSGLVNQVLQQAGQTPGTSAYDNANAAVGSVAWSAPSSGPMLQFANLLQTHGLSLFNQGVLYMNVGTPLIAISGAAVVVTPLYYLYKKFKSTKGEPKLVKELKRENSVSPYHE